MSDSLNRSTTKTSISSSLLSILRVLIKVVLHAGLLPNDNSKHDANVWQHHPFTSWAFTENVRRYGLLGSMGTVGDCYDCDAPMESFWGSMQIELLNRQRWITVVELSSAMADYIENFYNPARRHSSLNYLTP